MFLSSITTIIFGLLTIVLSSSVHEFAHAYSAFKLGDLTAKSEGRMTLNPLSHIAPAGLLSMLIAGIGWSKPVPINERNFEKPVLGTAITAIAGPTSNLILAIIFSIIYRLLLPMAHLSVEIPSAALPLQISLVRNTLALLEIPIMINLSLMLFNLLPIPPLDGYRVTRLFVPDSLKYYWEELEKYSLWLLPLLVLPITPIGAFVSIFIGNAISFLFFVATGTRL